uniref:cAMP-dependent protein kinase type II-alpha regulatory subunit n=1 Tax=Monopterus albus TaxID=43700 RepID=A0A3Q3KCU1_MONAL
MSNTELPAGLKQLLQGYTVEVLRHRPPNLVEFVVQHFTRILENQRTDQQAEKCSDKAARKGVTFEGNEATKDEEEEGTDVFEFACSAAVCAEAYNPDENDDAALCIAMFLTGVVFPNVPQEQFSEVLDEHIIDQGDDRDNFYVIEKGVYDIFVEKDGRSLCVGQYDDKGSFTELALMYNTPRTATIIASQEGALIGPHFTGVLFVVSLCLLFPCHKLSERMKIVDVLGARAFKDGQRIIAQGEKADCFYIVESGEVKIMIQSKANQQDNAEVEVARSASVYAVGETKCLVIDIQAFERLLGPCMDIMKRNISQYEDQLVALFGSSVDLKH